MKPIQSPEELERIRDQILANRDPGQICVAIAGGTCGFARGAGELINRFKVEIKKNGLEQKIKLKVTGCQGFCAVEPIVLIYPALSTKEERLRSKKGGVYPKRIFYQRVKPEDIPDIISQTLLKDKIVQRLLFVDPLTKRKLIYEDDIPFYSKQTRLLLANNSQLDPNDITDYIAIGGYAALAKALSKMKPEEIVQEVTKSGLRGRGGAGFLTGRKWQFCREAQGEIKYIVCNADEGDPGAYMDRSLLEGNPHSVLEGMIIGAFAIGARQGFIYIRNEYPLAVKTFKNALEQAKEWGFLGENILDSGFDLNIEVSQGAGAFVCGEETALINSIEGKIGEPRPRPPFPAQKGLWGKPTNINNVKTWANIPLVINKGADWFSKIGTETSKGGMIFSLVGKINNTGLVEVPMGITLRQMLYDIGGGIPNNKKFKAVQTGGPSGGCIPAGLIDIPVDYERLIEAGSMMGSGGMVVMDEDTCMVNVAKYFLRFTRDESCGKCTPCREGIWRMLGILERISSGKAKEEELGILEEMAYMIKETSLCALGRTAPNPVLTTLRYFKDEYLAHINEKRCPAKVCPELIRYSILPDKCRGCMACKSACPVEAISGEKEKSHKIDQSKCIKCGACFDACRFEAIVVK
jgi:NADH-quinone oxidoreductase subunit F